MFRPWMLPEGVTESLLAETKQIDFLEKQAVSLFLSWGYQRVRPPMIEYLESLVGSRNNEDLSEQTIQFKDQASGKLLGIRADITPQIARIDAHYLPTDKISRYAYVGDVVRFYPTGYGNLRNPTMAGIELFGSASWQADAEVVSLLIDYLNQVGVHGFVIDLGNVDIIHEILKAHQVTSKQHIFYDALLKKDKAEITRLAEDFAISKTGTDTLLSLLTLNGGEAVFPTAKSLFSNYSAVIKIIEKLEKTYNYLREFSANTQINIDLAEVRGYGYHNGLVFAAYQAGEWQSLARGGRYDQVGWKKERSAIGFSCNLNILSRLIDDKQIEIKKIKCDLPMTPELAAVIKGYRQTDIVVHDVGDNTANMLFTHALYKDDNNNFFLQDLR